MDVNFIRGVVTPLITPVDAEERVYETGMRSLIEHVLGGGVHGVFVLGSTGEFYGIDYDEKKRATEITSIRSRAGFRSMSAPAVSPRKSVSDFPKWQRTHERRRSRF